MKPVLPLCVVGLRFGRGLLKRYFSESQELHSIRLHSVCDLNADLTREVADEFNCRAYSSLEEVLADPEVRIVGLFTPPRKRAALISKILRAGKEVVTTKPFELDSRAAANVLREARQLGRHLFLNSPPPQPSPDIRLILDWTEKYQLGRLISAFGEVYSAKQEAADGSWYDDPQHCPLAPLFRLGIYIVNDLAQLVPHPVELQSQTSRIRTDRPTPDNAQMSIRYRDGALATIQASFCIDDGDTCRNSLILHFERGTIYRDVGPQREATPSHDAELSLVRGTGQQRQPVIRETVAAGAHFYYRWDLLAEAIHAHSPPAFGNAQALLEGIQIVEAMRLAEITSQPVKIEPLPSIDIETDSPPPPSTP
jgi:predicted dehydrogenase